MENMHRLQISTPFHVGRVNCYLITGNGLTLLDPGPRTEDAYDDLTEGLRNHDFTVADVDRVLITHPHLDHFGLASRIVEESDARTVAHCDATRSLADPTGHFDREQRLFRSVLREMGTPEQVVEDAATRPESHVDFRETLEVDREVTDGDSIDVGVDLQAIHTPGHAPGSVCYFPATEPVMFTGDHVLEHISPNPFLTVEPSTEAKRTRSLPTYLDSLRRVLEIDHEIGYAGHGETISDLNGRVHEILAHHRRRKERIATVIEEAGSITAYDIMRKLFPDLSTSQIYPGMSEVIGHLDLLEDEVRVDITKVDGVRRYSLRGD